MTPNEDFNEIARRRRESSFVGELFGMLRQQRKYWLMPLIVVLLLLGLLISLSGTAVAPFIYTLF